MRIASVGTAFPKNYYSQEALSANLKQHWAKRHHNLERLDQLHQNVLVGGRHLALPIDEYLKLDSFSDANDAFIRVAVDVGSEAIRNTLEPLGMTLRDVDHVFFVSTTGIATPSIDARIFNRIGVRPDVKRTPVFGLGCVAGAVGITRAADYVRAFPDQTALVVSVELCSLTLQRKDLSIPNIIASGLSVMPLRPRSSSAPSASRAGRTWWRRGPPFTRIPSASWGGTSARMGFTSCSRPTSRIW